MFVAAISGHASVSLVASRKFQLPSPKLVPLGYGLRRVPGAGGAVGASTLTDRTGVTLARANLPATRARGAYTRYWATVPGFDGTRVEKANVPDLVDFLLADVPGPGGVPLEHHGATDRGGSLPATLTVAPASTRDAEVVRLPTVGVAATAAWGDETATETAAMTASEAARSVASTKVPPRAEPDSG